MVSSIEPKLGGELAIVGVDKNFNNFPSKLISSEDIENMGIEWMCRDNIPDNLKNDSYIINTDVSSGPGMHWQCFVIQFPFIFWIDPFGMNFGMKPTKEIIKWGKDHHFNKLYASEMDIQPKFSNACGHISLYIAIHIKPLIGKLNEQSFDKFLSDNFDDGGTKNNMKEVINWTNKVGLT